MGQKRKIKIGMLNNNIKKLFSRNRDTESNALQFFQCKNRFILLW